MLLTDHWQQALRHRWLTGVTATDHDLVEELRSRRVKARLRLGVERVQLTRRIENLKNQLGQDESEDVPVDASRAAEEALLVKTESPVVAGKARERLTKAAKSDIFREVVLAAAREERRNQELEHAEKSAARTSSKTTTPSSSIPSRPKGA